MLTVEERERVRYHLGYLNITQQVSIGLGFPSASQLQFILESSMNALLPEGEAGVRRAIQELDCIEDQLSLFRTSLEVMRTGGGVEIRGPNAFRELEEQYVFWANGLSDTLGSPINPFGNRLLRLGAGPAGVIEPT